MHAYECYFFFHYHCSNNALSFQIQLNSSAHEFNNKQNKISTVTVQSLIEQSRTQQLRLIWPIHLFYSNPNTNTTKDLLYLNNSSLTLTANKNSNESTVVPNSLFCFKVGYPFGAESETWRLKFGTETLLDFHGKRKCFHFADKVKLCKSTFKQN